jgi:hypothetical protein
MIIARIPPITAAWMTSLIDWDIKIDWSSTFTRRYPSGSILRTRRIRFSIARATATVLASPSL